MNPINIDPFSWIPDSVRQQILDSAVDFVAEQAGKMLGKRFSDTFKTLKSDTAFKKTVSEGLKRATKRFGQEYVETDEELVTAVLESPDFWEATSIRDALLQMMKNPRRWSTSDREKVLNHFGDALPRCDDRERVDSAVMFFLQCLAEEVWQIPELRPIYHLELRRIAVENAIEMVAEIKGIRRDVRDVLIALVTSIQDQQRLPMEPSADASLRFANPLDAYLELLIDELGLWRGLDVGRAVRLEDCYVSHYVGEDKRNQQRITYKDDEFLQRLLRGGFHSNSFFIQGPAGSGKTTLLRYWALKLAEWGTHIPFLVSLGFVGQLCSGNSGYNVPLVRLVAEDFPDASGSAIPGIERALTEVINLGRAMILLDAADEIPEEARPVVARWLQRVRRSVQSCPIVVTSRPGNYLESPGGSLWFYLEPFDMNQRVDFIVRWFTSGNDAPRAYKMLKQLEESDRLIKISGNPLLLTMMCMEFDFTGRISETQGRIVDRFTSLLLQEWDALRGSRVSATVGDIPLDLKLRVLESTALHFFRREQYAFHERELIQHVSDLLASTSEKVGASEIIKDIVHRSGLLILNRMGYFRFSHPLFHEFFVARHQFTQTILSGESDKWLEDLSWQPARKYKNVIAFYNELMSGYDESQVRRS